MRLLLVDNADSFTRNLEHLLAAVAGSPPPIVAYRDFKPAMALDFDLTVISPGPGHPRDYPAYAPLLDSGRPVLGVCLGLQIMNLHFGGRVDRLPGCVHGKASSFHIFGRTVRAARYHSLYLSRLAPELEVLADWQGVPMAARHRRLPLVGFQFHPESFLTDDGPGLVRDALALILPG